MTPLAGNQQGGSIQLKRNVSEPAISKINPGL